MIIDALTHIVPPDRKWPAGHDAGLDRLLREMDAAGIDRACVMGPDASTESNAFILKAAEMHPDRLLPLGFFDPIHDNIDEGTDDLLRNGFRDRGFTGLKLHPRMHGYQVLDTRVRVALNELADWPKPPLVWICTYLYSPGIALPKSPVDSLFELVGAYPGLTFVLAHAGGPDALRLAHAVRHCPNAHLDLSYTQSHFKGSSVEADLCWLIDHFENRLLFGSDFPEVSPVEARRDFEVLSQNAKPGAVEKILGTNLARLLELK